MNYLSISADLATLTEHDDRVFYLVETLKEHCNLYYGNGSEISDEEYDMLELILKDEDPKNDFFMYPRSTWVIDSPFKKAKHQLKMASLDKVHSLDEVLAFMDKFEVDTLLVEDKGDGLSVEIIYENGKLVKGITRGDGEMGEDITRNVVKMKNVPLSVPLGIKSLRGEIVLLKEDFDALNLTLKKPLKNQRNGAVGTTKKLTGEGCGYLTVLHYDLVIEDSGVLTPVGKMEAIKSLGLKTVNFEVVTREFINDYFLYYQDHVRATLGYDIDGLVLKVNDNLKQMLFDEEGKNPKTQMAWKFENQTGISKIIGIDWQLKKGNRLSPVAVIEPLELAGVTIQNVTINNPAWIEEMGIHVGAEVVVARANDVIPKILSVIKGCDDQTVYYPVVCPECGEPVLRDERFLICNNPKCVAKAISILDEWCTVLEVKDIGLERIRLMYDAGIIQEPKDFYIARAEEIAPLEKMGMKSAEKILKQFESKKVTMVQFLAGINIDDISVKMAEKIVGAGFDTLEKILEASQEDIAKIEGMGPSKTEQFINGLVLRMEIIENLMLAGVEITAPAAAASDMLAGLSFCLTGTMGRKRPEIEKDIKANGGSIKGVSKELDYLVVGQEAGSKLDKATKLGIKILSEKELEALYA